MWPPAREADWEQNGEQGQRDEVLAGSSSPHGVGLDVAHGLSLLVLVICQVNSVVSRSGGEFRSRIRWTRFESWLRYLSAV